MRKVYSAEVRLRANDPMFGFRALYQTISAWLNVIMDNREPL